MTSAAGTPVRARHPIAEVMADPSYRAFWLSSFLSSIIFGGARFAWVWVVLEATDSPADAALAGGIALGLPNLLFSLPAGAYADRFDRRRMVLAASAFATAVLLVTAALAAVDRLSLAAALATAFALGITVSIVQPVQTAMVPQLVPPRLHLTGIALQNLSLQSSFFVGSLVTGALIDLTGAAATFLILAALQAASGLFMLPITFRPADAAPAGTGVVRPTLRRSISDGLRYTLRHQPLRSLAIANFVIGLVSASTAILLPEVARDELGKGAFAASALVAGIIPGMVVTTFWLASKPGLGGRGRLAIVGLFSVVPLMVISGLSKSYWLTLGNVLFWGVPMGFMATLLRQLTQEATSEEMMGRVMSVVHLFSRGTLPVASLGLLFLTRSLPAHDGLVVVGVGVALIATGIAGTPAVRRL
ncbi:MAG: MFS transporter [Acidimicrobiales bacterium]